MNKHRILMLVLMIVSVCVLSVGVVAAEDVNVTSEGEFDDLTLISTVSGADVGQEQVTDEGHVLISGTPAHDTRGNDSYDIIIANENFLQNTLDLKLNRIYEETENKDVLYLKDGYTIRITDIYKDVSPYKIRLILEKSSIELDYKILETGQEYSWYDSEDYITLNLEIFVGKKMNAIFFKNVNQISDEDVLINNETFTLAPSLLTTSLIDGSGMGGILSFYTANNNNIHGFTILNGNTPVGSFPQVLGHSQELLMENYSLGLQDIDIYGDMAWIVVYKNDNPVEDLIMSVGDIDNYNSLISLKLDTIFSGTTNNFIEISHVYQYSENDMSIIIENESALLIQGSNGRFIFDAGGIKWQLEENYTINAIDIDIIGHPREAMLLVTKDSIPVDHTIINISDSYTYYANENPLITADLETIFSGEGGVSLARLHHVYQISEDTGEILLSDAIHLYSVGNTREVEWQLNQNYSLSAMDIDSKNTPRQVWVRLKKDGNTLEDKFLHSEDSAIFYNSGTKILDLNVGTIFDGKEEDLVFISDVYQYSEMNENDILLENEPHLFIFGYTTGKDWQLYENYTLSFMDIDIKKYPNQVWLRMKKNGVTINDNVVAQNEEYRFYNNSVSLFEGYLKSSFGGRYLDMLTLTNANQYSELDSTPLIAEATYTFYPENVEIFMDLNDKLSLDENYTIVPVDISGFYYPDTRYYYTNESLWLRLYKDDVMVDEVILLKGQDYSYYSGNIKIISTKLATIFTGINAHLINFEDFYQYSEVDGSLINSYSDLVLRLGYYSPPGAPVIISFEPTTLISDVVGATRKYTIFVNQSVNVNWYLNGTEIQFNESVSNAEYTNTSASAGTWIISAIATNANGIAKQNWTWIVMAETELPVHNINTGENFSTIQAAIDDASPGDEIHVDSGTYYENVVVNKQLILRGDGNLATTIDGNGGEKVVEVIANEVVIEGFSIQNGSNGIYVTSSYNTLIGNTVLNNSNGILLYYSSNNNMLIGNTASNNSITGIWLYYLSNNNTLIGNLSLIHI